MAQNGFFGVLVVMVASAALSTGCLVAPGATNSVASPAARTPLRSAHGLVRVEGQGRVVGDRAPVDCGAPDGACAVAWDGLAQAALVAEPAPGWRLAGWRWKAADGAPLAPGLGGGEGFEYTAVFVPASDVAQR